MFSIFDIVPDPTSPQITLLVTKYTSNDGSFLCVPIVGQEPQVKVQVSAMRFVPSIKLTFGLGKVGVPPQLAIEIEQYILDNEKLFKNRIEDFEKVMSENRDEYPMC